MQSFLRESEAEARSLGIRHEFVGMGCRASVRRTNEGPVNCPSAFPLAYAASRSHRANIPSATT